MNKPWARRAIGAGIALAVGIAMSGCAASGGSSGSAVSGDGEYSGPDVEITFWHGWTGGAAPTIVPKLIEEFNAEHDNIKVKGVPQEWGDIAAKMPLAIKAGKGPDVAVLHGDDLATYAAQNLLLNAEAIVDGLGYDADDFPPGVFDKGNYGDVQYAVPWSVTPLGLYVNKTVLAEAGITEIPTDEESYIAALEALKGVGVAGRVGGRLRLHGHLRVREPDLAVRRRALQRGRHRGDVQLGSRSEGADLDDRHGRRGLQPGERRAGRQHQGADLRRHRLQLERCLADDELSVRRTWTGRQLRCRRSAASRPCGRARPTGCSRPTRVRTRTRPRPRPCSSSG